MKVGTQPHSDRKALLPLLPPDYPSHKIRPLRSLTATQRGYLESRVGKALRRWCDAWGIDDRSLRVVPGQLGGNGVCCLPEMDTLAAIDENRWFLPRLSRYKNRFWVRLEQASSESARMHVHGNEGLQAILYQALYREPFPSVLQGSSTEATLALSLVTRAWDDWWNGLAGELGLDELDGKVVEGESTPQALLRPWSGAARIGLNWCGCNLSILIGASDIANVENLVEAEGSHSLGKAMTRASAHSVVPVFEALESRTEHLTVELLPTQVDLHTLAHLRIGDVLSLAHSLDTPIIVKLGDGRVFCQGFLGKLDGWRAVELASLDAAQVEGLSKTDI